MFWKKKAKPRSSGWLYQIRDTSGLKFETQDDPDEISPKQALRVRTKKPIYHFNFTILLTYS